MREDLTIPSRDLVEEVLDERIDRVNDVVGLLKLFEGVFGLNKPVEVATFYLLVKSMEVPLRTAESIDILAKL